MTAPTVAQALRLCAVLVLGACRAPSPSDDDTDHSDTDVDVAAPSLAGAWRVTAGGADFRWMFSGRPAELAHLDLTDSGKGAGTFGLFGGDPSGQVDCQVAVWTRVTDGSLLVTDPYVIGATSRLLLLSFPDADTLELSDDAGKVLRLVREDAVPEVAQCGQASLVDAVDVAASFEWWANLVWDGASLRFPVQDGAAQAVDLTTGALSDPWTFGWDQFQRPVAMQGGVPWITCGCGANQEIHHTQPGGTELDVVDTNTLGHGVHIQGAVVTDDDLLWLYGSGQSDEHTWFVSVDTSAEPDVLSAEVQTTASLRQLALLDGGVYSLGYRSVHKVELSTGHVLRSWNVAGLAVGQSLVGLASDGSKLWVAIGDDSNTTVVASLVLP